MGPVGDFLDEIPWLFQTGFVYMAEISIPNTTGECMSFPMQP